MSDVLSTEEVVAGALDRVLRRCIEAEAVTRVAEQEARSARDASSDLEREAQRLRMALFALEGKADKNHGDVNQANHERRIELQRGGVR